MEFRELTSKTYFIPRKLQTAKETLSGMQLAMRCLDPGRHCSHAIVHWRHSRSGIKRTTSAYNGSTSQ